MQRIPHTEYTKTLHYWSSESPGEGPSIQRYHSARAHSMHVAMSLLILGGGYLRLWLIAPSAEGVEVWWSVEEVLAN